MHQLSLYLKRQYKTSLGRRGLVMSSRGEFPFRVAGGFPVIVQYTMVSGYADWHLENNKGNRLLFIEAKLTAAEEQDIGEECHLDNNHREWSAGRPRRGIRC